MKLAITTARATFSAGYALVVVLGVTGVSAIMLAAVMNRTTSVAKLNERNNQYIVLQNAAEAAAEKVFARMAYDFANGGLPQAVNNLPLYVTNIPNASENSYWTNFVFSNGQGNDNRTGVYQITNYSGNLPSQYPGVFTVSSPVYRILSNVRMQSARYNITAAVQVDVMLALVPITTYAIFYNGLLEFSQCATMIVSGRVHSNTNIYVGTISSASLTFSNTVTAGGTITAPSLNGSTWGTGGNTSLRGNTFFYGSPASSTNNPPVNISINMTNTRSIIDIPTTNDSSTLQGQQRLFNQAQVVLIVSNNTVTMRIQASPSSSDVPGADTTPITLTSSNTVSALSTNFPFLVTTNTFTDKREGKTIFAAQIDVGRYRSWIATNTSVLTKFPSGSGTWPTILYVADNRTNSSSQLSAIRLTNGTALPSNGGLGFTVATPNPLYVWGHYNQTNSSLLGQNNTSSGTVPAALISDALTVLSPAWRDVDSAVDWDSTRRNATDMTLNAAIITGNVPSTGLTSTTFSGGVHNLPRMLENWSGDFLTFNTSIVNLFASARATSQWKWQGTGNYVYNPPTRQWAFDLNFYDPARQPPGVPTALVPIRYNWCVPPPNTTNYNVIP